MTSNILPAIPLIPPGMKGCLVTSPNPIAEAPGNTPKINPNAVRIKKIIANTLIADNPLVSFPILSTPNKLIRVIPTMIDPPSQAIDTFGYQLLISMEIAVASLDIESIVPVQYSQPTTKPVP